jgi:hypothetical protein
LPFKASYTFSNLIFQEAEELGRGCAWQDSIKERIRSCLEDAHSFISKLGFEESITFLDHLMPYFIEDATKVLLS